MKTSQLKQIIKEEIVSEIGKNLNNFLPLFIQHGVTIDFSKAQEENYIGYSWFDLEGNDYYEELSVSQKDLNQIFNQIKLNIEKRM